MEPEGAFGDTTDDTGIKPEPAMQRTKWGLAPCNEELEGAIASLGRGPHDEDHDTS